VNFFPLAWCGGLMYNSRDDKSFTRVRNYRHARRYRVFSAVISRGTPKKKVNNHAGGQIFVSDNGRFVFRLKERLFAIY